MLLLFWRVDLPDIISQRIGRNIFDRYIVFIEKIIFEIDTTHRCRKTSVTFIIL